MAFDYQQIPFFFKKYRNLLIAGGLALILAIAAIMMFTDWLGHMIDMHKIFGWESNINALQQDANQINVNINAINAENREMEININAQKEDYNRAVNGTNQARTGTNRALENLNGVLNKDFNGTSAQEANRLRCQAFPDRPECRPK